MSDDEVKESAGLEGVVAAESSISDIDGLRGRLIYAGYDIQDLAENTTFEEVCFLLWNLRLPTQTELDDLKEQFDRDARLPDEFLAQLQLFSKEIPPMDALRSGASLLSQIDPNLNDSSLAAMRARAIRMTARIPTIVAVFDRFRNGKEPVAYKSGLGFSERFLYLLKGEQPISEAKRAIDMALVLHAEHGFNASTFAARVTIATLSDMYSAMTSAIGTLKGPLHGGANEQVILMLQDMGTIDRAEEWIADQLRQEKRIFGFGHRVYKTLDPRARVLRAMSENLSSATGKTRFYEMSTRIEDIMKEKKNINANVDFYSASVYSVLGIPTDLFTPIFAISRMAGWTAHVLEQWQNNRLIRPVSKYVGSLDRKVQAIAERTAL